MNRDNDTPQARMGINKHFAKDRNVRPTTEQMYEVMCLSEGRLLATIAAFNGLGYKYAEEVERLERTCDRLHADRKAWAKQHVIKFMKVRRKT